MSAILPHMVYSLSANLGCRSETCCLGLAENTGRKNRHLRTIAQFCRAISSQRRHVSTIGKKLVKQQYLLHMLSQYGETALLKICSDALVAADIGMVTLIVLLDMSAAFDTVSHE